MHGECPADGHEGMSRRGLLALMGTAAGALAAYPDVVKAHPRVARSPSTRSGRARMSLRISAGSRALRSDTLPAGDRRRERLQGGRSGHRGRRRGRGNAEERPRLLANTKIKDLYEHPLFVDDLQQLIWQTTDQAQYAKVQDWTMGQLEGVSADRARARDQGRHVWPDQRHDRLRPEADEQSGADRAGPEDLQRVAGHQDGGEGLYGRAHPAQLARQTIPTTSSGRSSTRLPTRPATSSSAPIPSTAPSTASPRSKAR